MLTENDYLNSSLGIIELPDGFIINGHKYDQNFKFTGDIYRISNDAVCTYCSTFVTSNGDATGIECQQYPIQNRNDVYFIKNNTQIWKYNLETHELTLFYENTTDHRPYMLLKINTSINCIFLITKNNGYNYDTSLTKINLETKAVTNISWITTNRYGIIVCDISGDTIKYLNYYVRWSQYGTITVEQIFCHYETSGNTEQIYTYINQDKPWGNSYSLNTFNISNIAPASEYMILGRQWDSYLNISLANINDPSVIKKPGITYTSNAPLRFWNINENIFMCFYNGNGNSNISKFYKFNFNTEELTIIYDDNKNLIKTILLSKDKNIVLLNELNKANIYMYNENLQTYEKKGEINDINQIGLDSNNNIWYLNNLSEIRCETLTDPSKVSVVFEKPMYTYTESNIETYLDFKAESGLGTYAPGNYILELSNNAYFEESHTNILNIVYESGVVRYNIIICGNGKVKCKVKFRKSWSR